MSKISLTVTTADYVKRSFDFVDGISRDAFKIGYENAFKTVLPPDFCIFLGKERGAIYTDSTCGIKLADIRVSL